VGPALAAGCTTVLKPSELTPLTALALRNLAIQAGIPESVFQVVTPDRDNTPTVGKEFCTNPLVRKISFTGSTVVGKQLMEWSSGTMKRLSLELGGNAPFIVFDDADLDQAVQAAISSKFRNAGQTCVCADRFLVQSGVHDEFVQRFAEQVRQTYYDGAMGPGLEESNVMGPMISASALENVDQKVQSAIQEGAKCIIGGRRRVDIGPHFYEPTILTHVSKDSLIWKTETFGPVAPIQSFDTEEEALEIANDCRVGLASYFCSRDLSRAFRFAKQLESGLVAMNEGILSTCYAPFGGVKESGLGREGSPLGLQEYLETKYIFMNY
jgi:succinate-semialdehyde dehydrogenase/glutarate-semialdehyde dehydrogenase